jgi:hypothetical protein
MVNSIELERPKVAKTLITNEKTIEISRLNSVANIMANADNGKRYGKTERFGMIDREAKRKII